MLVVVDSPIDGIALFLYCHIILFAADKMESFMKQCPDFPNALLVGGPSDIFVIELTDQVRLEFGLLVVGFNI